MFELIFTDAYEKRARKFLKKHPDLKTIYEKTLLLMEQNVYHPSLRLHKFSDLYSVSINLQYRISIEFLIEDDKIIPVDIGDHKDIYGKD